MMRIALAKGRTAKKALELFRACGITFPSLEHTRKLIIPDESGNFEIVLTKPSDTAIYVQRGVCDCGIVGRDILVEDEPDVYTLFALGISKCTMCVAGKKGFVPAQKAHLRIATKFENTAKKIFEARDVSFELIKLNGSVELAPLLGMSDVIVDIVESGETLRENDLVVIEKLFEISACFIANKVALKTKKERIFSFMEKLKQADEELNR